MTDYWIALQVTVGVEILVGAALTRWSTICQVPLATVCLAVLGINLVTHPVAWYAAGNFPGSWTTVEALVMVVEFLLLRVVFKSRAWPAGLLAMATNGATLLLSISPGWAGL